ncbi:class D beta-lactamase [Thioalkalivibrio sp. XN279]|uniref:class D beta-lactamase n=1 Tax=Thioalkalivibrio sp. XN279 TaxID=2714953 RepID=UPI00140AAB5D|nr:class D beta-lactamase [Thioalkalivibrio sp. XN279]NHA15764.1 class D beta-lactamase [Thioalkalivibrio sp. XN279]
MRALRLVVLVAPLACGAACGAAAPQAGVTVIADPGVTAELDGREAIFYAIDLADGRHYAWALERADEPHTPYSTFKIPNLLIALETGVAGSVDDLRQRDPERRPAEPWWSEAWREDQTLAQAFRRSTVWYFRDLALEVGGPRYREMLRAFDYGNAMAPDDNDTLWLIGPLAISPREQAEFIVRLVQGELPLRPENVMALEEVSLLEARDGCRLHGKTGSGPVDGGDMDGPFEGWLVGWVDCAGTAPVAYALFVRGPSYASIAQFRGGMARSFLRRVGAWPDASE